MDSPAPYRTLLPPEEALLLICARREIPDRLLKAGAELTSRVDWDRWLQLALDHGVGPLVYASLKRHFVSVAPESCLAHLKQFTLANAQNNLSLLRELSNTARLLESNKIQFAVFKGLVINETVYQDLGVRKCGDIDLLVDRKDFERAKALFVAEGFAPTLPDSAEIQFLQSGLWHEGRRLNIDLHWGIPPREVGVRADKTLDNLTRISIGGVDLPTFSREDLFIVMCVNATKEYWNQHLYPYCDIHEFLLGQPNLNWKALMARARGLKCERMVLAALCVVEALFEHSPPHRRSRAGSSTELAAQELLRQLFDLRPEEGTIISHSRHLYLFDSTDDYFFALIDTPLRKLTYRLIHMPLRRFAPEAMGVSDTPLPRGLAFLVPIIRTARISRLILRKAYEKLGKRA